MDSRWSWLALSGGTIAYWFVTGRLWLALRRRSARRKKPRIVTRISDNETLIAFVDEIDLLRVGAVWLGPPIAAWILFLVTS